MNYRINIAIAAVVGGGVGWFVGAVIADYIDEKELRDRAPENRIDDEEETTSVDDEEESSTGDKSMSKKNKPPKKEKINYTQYFNGINRPDLAALAQKYNDGVLETEPLDIKMIDDDAIPDVVPTVSSNGITIISAEEFNTNDDDFEVVELSYFADEIVVGEDDNVIPDPEDIIGDEALVSFGMRSEDPDIVYIRNTKTRALYEIVRMSSKYAIDADADTIIPRKGLKKGIDFDEVIDDQDDEEANS